jgi:hypothetical protein
MTLKNESDARTHRTPKALRAKWTQRLFHVAKALGVRARPRAALAVFFVTMIADPKIIRTMTDWLEQRQRKPAR